MSIFFIEPAAIEDIVLISQLEQSIEKESAATIDVLLSRWQMFPEGFLVVKNKKKNVIGYLESLVWFSRDFETFTEIQDFPTHFNKDGNELYIIFLAVSEEYRKQGVATKLLCAISEYAKNTHITNIKLVAKEHLIHLYEVSGFVVMKELPNFLKNKEYRSFIMNKKINIV